MERHYFKLFVRNSNVKHNFSVCSAQTSALVKIFTKESEELCKNILQPQNTFLSAIGLTKSVVAKNSSLAMVGAPISNHLTVTPAISFLC